ncbi:MAG: biotin--[acetyl-CoA-carboxylase] ligase [Pseudomonadota bacterium]
MVDSTNAEAARRAAAGERGPCWIMARRQQAGRGRIGRRWSAETGNLTATYLFAPDCSPAAAALFAFTASLAVTGLIAASGARLQGGALKWPNDVLIGGKKVAGILLESSGSGGRIDWLAIGIGVNLVSAPSEDALRAGGRPATCLTDEGGAALSQEDALQQLAEALSFFLEIHAEQGFADGIRGFWLAQAERLDEEIEVRTEAQSLRGFFRGVDEHGRLILEAFADGQRHHFAAADIYFPD